MPELTVNHLGATELDKAYPLVRTAAHVTVAQWESFGRRLLAEGGGVLAVRAGEDCLHGLAAFRRTSSLRHGATLQVEVIIAFELSGSGSVRKALCGALERQARAQGCGSLLYTFGTRSHLDPQSAGRASWEELGLEMQTVGYVQQLQPVGRPDNEYH